MRVTACDVLDELVEGGHLLLVEPAVMAVVGGEKTAVAVEPFFPVIVVHQLS